MLNKEDYVKTEEQFYNILMSSVKNEIYLYCVTGSLSRDEIILGWSDIDVLIIIKDYKKATLESVSDALSKIKNGIKIGVTIFSLEEFNHKYFKDSKTYISIKFIRNGYYKPKIMLPEIKLIETDESLKKYMDISDFSKFSHDIKRELLKMNSYDEKKVYKLIIILLKIALYQIGVVTLGCKDTLLKASEHLPNFNPNILDPEKIMANSENKMSRYFVYLDFLEWLRMSTNNIFR